MHCVLHDVHSGTELPEPTEFHPKGFESRTANIEGVEDTGEAPSGIGGVESDEVVETQPKDFPVVLARRLRLQAADRDIHLRGGWNEASLLEQIKLFAEDTMPKVDAPQRGQAEAFRRTWKVIGKSLVNEHDLIQGDHAIASWVSQVRPASHFDRMQ